MPRSAYSKHDKAYSNASERGGEAVGTPTNADTTEDWKTVGKTFRATDAVYGKSLPNASNEEGRPPH